MPKCTPETGGGERPNHTRQGPCPAWYLLPSNRHLNQAVPRRERGNSTTTPSGRASLGLFHKRKHPAKETLDLLVLLEPFTDSPNNHHHRPVASFWGRARCIEQRTTTEGRARWFESTEHNRRAVPDGLNQRHTTVGPCPSAGSAAANEQSESQTFSERFPRTAPRCERPGLSVSPNH